MIKLSKKTSINLLPGKDFSTTTTGRVISWLLSTFRTLVILTEIVVVSAFVYRFRLDTQNQDITEEIEQKKQTVLSFSSIETKYAETLTRINIYKTFNSNEFAYSDILKEITKKLPNSITLSTVGVKENSVSVSGSSPKEIDIQQFIVNLNASQMFDNVNLAQFGTQSDNTAILFFELAMTLSSTKEDQK